MINDGLYTHCLSCKSYMQVVFGCLYVSTMMEIGGDDCIIILVPPGGLEVKNW